MYKVVLINFNNCIYEGADRIIAIMKAQQAGFEAALYAPDGHNMLYSPISGWKSV